MSQREEEVLWRTEYTTYVTQNFGRLTAVARSVMGQTDDDAEDAVQEALVTLVRKWRRVREASNIDAYVTSMVINECRRKLRRRRRRTETEVSLAQDSSEPMTNDRAWDEIADLRAAIRSLPERQREVVALYYLFDMQLKQVALAMHTSEGTAKSQLFKARKALNDYLTGEPKNART